MHLTSSPVAWYAARAGGIVAYILLTIVVLLGLQMSSKRKLPGWPRIAIEDVHRFASFAAGSFVVIHIVAIAIDSYLPFSLPSLVVPFIARYRPAWVGVGIVAAELMLAVAIANRMRGRILSYDAWRKTHYATFAVWTAATIHGIASGTDRSTAWLIALALVSTAAVATLTARRIMLARMRRAAAATADRGWPIAASAGVLAAAVIAILALGPFRSHTKPWNAANFSDNLSGRIERRNGSIRGLVSLAGTGDGAQRVLVRADLLLAPTQLVNTSFQMEYLPSGDVCRGRVTSIDDGGLGFQATCSLGDGSTRNVHASWLQGESADISGGTLDSSD